MYMRVEFHRNFKKQYKKLPLQERKRCDQRIALFLSDPFHPTLHNHALSGEYRKYRSINITGDERAVYEPITKDIAFFIFLGTHSELYE